MTSIPPRPRTVSVSVDALTEAVHKWWCAGSREGMHRMPPCGELIDSLLEEAEAAAIPAQDSRPLPLDRNALAYALATHLCYGGVEPGDKAIDVLLERYDSFTSEKEAQRQDDLAEKLRELADCVSDLEARAIRSSGEFHVWAEERNVTAARDKARSFLSKSEARESGGEP